MKKTGFELFKTRPFNDILDIPKFEKDNNILLAPLYKTFISTFYVGKDKIIGEMLMHPKFGFKVDLMSMTYYPNEKAILLYNFLGLDDIKNIYSELFSEDIEITQNNLLPIGECGMSWMLMVGLKGINADNIFLEKPDMSPRFIFIAENIFEFIRGLVQEEDKFGNIGNYNFSQLYKNWDEDFWRVREE